ncbi:hypothetical protein PIB30_078376 [Stylosanthes scabra]|uniref:Uncharacterized protein n=1 Tax=Stylosanthes scabra TaxID=79078 RepID=A0ABU6RR25_9FABA|nr:hypothetical protein [Stylosanthes scabra]
MSSNRRASSPSLMLYVNHLVHAPPLVGPAFEDDVGVGTMKSPDRDDQQAGGVNSDSSEDDEFILEIQPPVFDPVGIPTIASPLNRVLAEAGHYSIINSEGMQSGSTEDMPSHYLVFRELEIVKFINRETAMLAVKNYNIRRSAVFKVVESDSSRRDGQHPSSLRAEALWNVSMFKGGFGGDYLPPNRRNTLSTLTISMNLKNMRGTAAV